MSTFDFHVHCYPELLARKALQAMTIFTSSFQTDGTWDRQWEYMARHDVPHCTVLNVATRPKTMHNVNLYALESMLPNQLIFGSVHPQAENAIEELEWLYAQGIRGVKLHTGYQVFNFDDPAYFPLYRRIGELGMATSIHCGPFFEDRDHLVYPSVVARAIDQFQGAPFICAHMGGIHPDHPDFKLLCDMPVYVDTALASHMMNQEQFYQFVMEFGNERILFGTDMPWENPEDLIKWMRPVIMNTDDINADMIYYDNAMELCRKLVPEQWAQWKKNDVVLTEEDGAQGKGDVLAWYNNLD